MSHCKTKSRETFWTCPNCKTNRSAKRIRYPVYCMCGLVEVTKGEFTRVEINPPAPVSSMGLKPGEVINQENRIEAAYRLLKRREEEGRAAWRELHCYTGQPTESSISDMDWLIRCWQPMIPRFGCRCEEFYFDYVRDHPPDFSSPESIFAWGFDLHNAVNRKLLRPEVTFASAWQRWRPHLAWDIEQPVINGLVAVTSLSPLDKHIEVQREVLDSWCRFGLRVISGNSSSECETLRRLYPEVEFRPVRLSSSYIRPTARIRDLMELGGSEAVLLINSDIAIYGEQLRITSAIAQRRSIAGVRWNWVGHPGRGIRENWGIDAFLLYPEQIRTFPDLDLAIGQTLWDYWVPYHLEQRGFPCEWIGDPYFFHREHPKHWGTESLAIGTSILSSHYDPKYCWDTWRRSMPFAEGV